MTAKKEQHLNTFHGWLVLLANIVAVVAGIVAVWQYRDNSHATRVGRSMDYIRLFETEQYSNDEIEIDKASLKMRETLNQPDNAAEMGRSPPAEAEAISQSVAINAAFEGGNGDIARPFVDVINFFGELQICIEQRLCDDRTAHAFFDEYALAFWANFKPAVDQARKLARPTFGVRMERFVRGAKAAK